MEQDAIHPESLLEHAPRLRALARRLVGEADADDLVQETWLRAVKRGPRGATPWSWLGRVLRNLASDERRSGAARAERELEAARNEATEDEGERFALHKALVAALERLDAPYRQAILLRYFEGLPPRKIATRLGVPVKTVKTRLNRGIALLREELDRRPGGREAWLAAMLPLAARIGGSGALLSGPALAIGAAVLVVSSSALFFRSQTRHAVTGEVGPGSPAPMSAASAPSGPSSQGSRTPEPLAAPASISSPRSSAPLVAGLRGGRVLDANGLALAGVWVGFAGDDAPAPVQSDANGEFALPDLAGTVVSRDAGFATVLASELDPAHARPEDLRVVVVAPPVTLVGVVRDETGGALAGAGVQLAIPPSFRARFRELLDTSQTWKERQLATEADADGRFRFENVPGLACAKLVAHWGHASSPAVAVPERDALGIELAVTIPQNPPLGANPLHLVGEARHADGSLAPGALVSLGGATTHADGEGLFELWAPRPQAAPVVTMGDGISGGLSIPSAPGSAEAGALRRLVAVLPGELPAIVLPGLAANGDELWPSFASLWLGGAPRSIDGSVLGTDGRAVAGASVWIEDLSFVAKTRDGFLTLEHQMAGKSDQRDDRWFQVRADDEGRFELGGLCERSYALAAMDPATLQIVRTEPIAAGSTGVQLVFDAGELQRVAGRVVDTHGSPRAGAHLALTRDTYRVQSARDVFRGSEQLSAGSNDEDGRFELPRVPRSGVVLEVSAAEAGTPTVKLTLEELADALDVRVVVPVMARVQVTFAGVPREEAKLVFRDAEERPLHFYLVGGATVWGRSDIELGDANLFDPVARCTSVISVPDTVRAAVLLAPDGSELARMPVMPAGDLTIVRF